MQRGEGIQFKLWQVKKLSFFSASPCLPKERERKAFILGRRIWNRLPASPFFSAKASVTVLASLKIETAVQSPSLVWPIFSVRWRQWKVDNAAVLHRTPIKIPRQTPPTKTTIHLRSNHSLINPNCFSMDAKSSRFSGQSIARAIDVIGERPLLLLQGKLVAVERTHCIMFLFTHTNVVGSAKLGQQGSARIFLLLTEKVPTTSANKNKIYFYPLFSVHKNRWKCNRLWSEWRTSGL